MVVSINGGTQKIDGLFHGKSPSKMDDDWGYSYFKEPKCFQWLNTDRLGKWVIHYMIWCSIHTETGIYDKKLSNNQKTLQVSMWQGKYLRLLKPWQYDIGRQKDCQFGGCSHQWLNSTWDDIQEWVCPNGHFDRKKCDKPSKLIKIGDTLFSDRIPNTWLRSRSRHLSAMSGQNLNVLR